MDLSNLREQYTQAGLSRKDLSDDPVQQFEIWFKQAQDAGLLEPNAMSLATVSAHGQPSVRTVLLKYFDKEGFIFYTNYGSQKARDIAENPKVGLLFPWLDLHRQVRINGAAEKIPAAVSLKYFLSRPRGSQIGAWISEQSSPISSRQMLLAKFDELKEKFKNKEVPLPTFWGGYRVVPVSFEFWQGCQDRLHDRFLYTPDGVGGWKVERLAP